MVDTYEQVDVFDALAWLDVRVIFKPLDGLLGAYVRGDQPGVMISTKRPLSVQRFTAAHELGHAVLAHEPSLDSPNVLRRAAYSQGAPKIPGFASYLQEIEADAFAGSFLLPNWLISHHANKHGWSRTNLSNEDTVYQMALRCGASYQATVWALQRNGIIDEQARGRLLNVPPKQIKKRLGHVTEIAEVRNDAWVLSERDSQSGVSINVGDTVTISLAQQAAAGYLWLAKTSPPTVLKEIDSKVCFDPAYLGDASMVQKFYIAEEQGAGCLAFEHKRPWESNFYEEAVFCFSVSKPEQGLSRANRARLVKSRRDLNAP